jgi:hypothetical protein
MPSFLSVESPFDAVRAILDGVGSTDKKGTGIRERTGSALTPSLSPPALSPDENEVQRMSRLQAMRANQRSEPIGTLCVVDAAAHQTGDVPAGSWKILGPADWGGTPFRWFAVSDGEQIVALFKRICHARQFIAER